MRFGRVNGKPGARAGRRPEAAGEGKVVESSQPAQKSLQVARMMAVASWAGPLPPPEMLAKYNEAFPGCAERIVHSAELQSAHRQQLEQSALKGKLANESRGQLMAFILALCVLIGGFALIFLDKSILGTIFIGTDLAALVGIFVYGRHDQRSRLEQKAKAAFPKAENPPELPGQ